MTYLQSSQNFVRALKAPNDPPNTDSPTKIDIARQVWEDASFNVQYKADAIIEFVLTRLLKDKGKTADSPVTDGKYWQLLSSVLAALPLSTSSATSTKTWLLPLLNRTPLVPICTSLLERSSEADSEAVFTLLNISSQAIAALWPLASPKFTADALLECFGALLLSASHLPDESPGLTRLGILISTSLQEAFSNSSNKKKMHQAFTQTHLERWAICVARMDRSSTENTHTLYTELYHTGRDILFNADTLKGLSEPSSLKALFASLLATEASLLALPKLLQAFAVASRKNRTLFGTGTSAPAAARSIAMSFFTACTDYLRGAPDALFPTACAARLELLRVVEEESLLGFGQADSQQAIQREVALCISALPSNGDLTPSSAILLDSLCVISRIDHDLLEPHLPELLPRTLSIPPSPHPAATSAFKLLTLCISYHSRARSLPSLLGHVQTVFASLSSTQRSVRELYPRVASSPLHSQSFFAALAKAVHTFVTPGQVLSTAQDLVESLTRVHETYTSLSTQSAGDSGHGPRKKARKSRTSTGVSVSSESVAVDAAALSFAALSRLAACILPALPVHSVTPDTQEDIRTYIRQADFVKHDLLRPESHDEEDRRADPWAADIVLAASLRLVYALQAATQLQFPSLVLERMAELLGVHQRSNVLPELFLETSRYLLKTATSDAPEERSAVFDRIILFLERRLRVLQAWSGRSAELAHGDDGTSQAATGLLRLVLDRFIGVFDAIATQVQLDRLVELLSKAVAAGHHSTDALTPAMVAQSCLRSAQLWEQRRFRSSLLSSINSRLQGIDSVHFDTIMTAAPCSLSLLTTGLKSDVLDRALEGYHLLLYCPAEYLSKSSRADILRRAVILDMTLIALDPETHGNAMSRKIVRTFLQRTFHALGSAEHQYVQPYLESLIRSASAEGADDKTTLEIVDAHIRTVLRTAQRGSVEVASKLIATLLPLQPRQSSPEVDFRMDTLRTRLMSILTRDFVADSLPTELKAALNTYQGRVSGRIESLSSTLLTTNGALLHGSVVSMISAYLRFSSWLGLSEALTTMPMNATDLVRTLVVQGSVAVGSSKASGGIPELVFDFVVSELESSTDAREDRIARMLASYVSLCQLSGLSDHGTLDELVSGAARRLSAEEYAFSLNLVAEMLCDDQTTRTVHAVRLGSVLLRGAPEGTLKMTQAFFTRVLCAFVDYPGYTTDSLLHVHVLELLDQQCCERPASLRLTNLTTIWPLLARILTGAHAHDRRTSSIIFHKIVSIVGALVRLRRDLIVNTLPHLCIVLRMLVACLRGPRPNLGEKQRQIVAKSLPAWVDPSQPLGAEESKALARLMTTLATKTVVRIHAGSSESQKADSLARPLSKHVAYVIQAFVGAVNDPLCVVPLAVRQELMPGLFVLCGMLNEHDRDALMVSGLDAAGKAALKALWRDYEKQRYVGKG